MITTLLTETSKNYLNKLVKENDSYLINEVMSLRLKISDKTGLVSATLARHETEDKEVKGLVNIQVDTDRHTVESLYIIFTDRKLLEMCSHYQSLDQEDVKTWSERVNCFAELVQELNRQLNLKYIATDIDEPWACEDEEVVDVKNSKTPTYTFFPITKPTWGFEELQDTLTQEQRELIREALKDYDDTKEHKEFSKAVAEMKCKPVVGQMYQLLTDDDETTGKVVKVFNTTHPNELQIQFIAVLVSNNYVCANVKLKNSKFYEVEYKFYDRHNQTLVEIDQETRQKKLILDIDKQKILDKIFEDDYLVMMIHNHLESLE